MKSLRLTATALGLTGLAITAHAECVYPEQGLDMPDGSSATKEQMVETQKAVKTYMEQMETYLACLKEEHTAAVAEVDAEENPEAVARREAMFTKRHDAAVDQMHLVGAQFNEQVRAFKSQSD